MFELNPTETEKWRCQFGRSNPGYKKGLRHAPFAFTEHGILMLSSVLNSEKAVEVNIAIMRVFLRLREMILTNREFALHLQKLERTVERHGGAIEKLITKVSRLTAVKKAPDVRSGSILKRAGLGTRTSGLELIHGMVDGGRSEVVANCDRFLRPVTNWHRSKS